MWRTVGPWQLQHGDSALSTPQHQTHGWRIRLTDQNGPHGTLPIQSNTQSTACLTSKDSSEIKRGVQRPFYTSTAVLPDVSDRFAARSLKELSTLIWYPCTRTHALAPATPQLRLAFQCSCSPHEQSSGGTSALYNRIGRWRGKPPKSQSSMKL